MFDLTIRDFNGEARMCDIEIAEALDFERGRDLRKLIDRSAARLTKFGEIIRATVARIDRPGPDPDAYWLNEHQCFYICTQSKTEKAFEVTRQIINLFVAHRNGWIPPPQALTAFVVTPDTPTHLALVREVRLTKGIAAAREMYDQLPLPPVASGPVDPPAAAGRCDVDAKWYILSFLRGKCIISGDPRDWTRSRDVIIAYGDYCVETDGERLGSRSFNNRLIALSKVYRCPDSGARFWQQKRSDAGYSGLSLIPPASPHPFRHLRDQWADQGSS